MVLKRINITERIINKEQNYKFKPKAMKPNVLKSFKGVELTYGSKVKIFTKNSVFVGNVHGIRHDNSCLILTDTKELNEKTNTLSELYIKKTFVDFFDFIIKKLEVVEL